MFSNCAVSMRAGGLNTRVVQRIENGQPATATAATQAQQAEQLALAQVRKIRGFYIHLAQYVVVITVMAVINLVTHPSKLWFFWPALGWGIGVLAHAAATFEFIPFFGAEWERKQVEKQLGRPL